MYKIRQFTRLLLLITLLILSISTVVSAQAKSPLNRVHGRVEAAYLADSEIYRYLADVNLWFDFGQYKDLVFFFNGGIQTYISDNDEDSFDLERFRGTIQPGTYLVRDKNVYYFYVKHQSFHDIDQFDNLDESYEVYTLAYKYSGIPTFFVSAGTFLNTTDVDYDWEYIASLEYSCIGRCRNNPVYISGSVRRVTEDGNPTGRDGFTDYTAELGVQTTAGLRYFTGYRVIHDVNQFNGIKDNQFLLGLKYIW